MNMWVFFGPMKREQRQTGVGYGRAVLGVRQRPQDLFRASFNLR